jgi:hypothetical protein
MGRGGELASAGDSVLALLKGLTHGHPGLILYVHLVGCHNYLEVLTNYLALNLQLA